MSLQDLTTEELVKLIRERTGKTATSSFRLPLILGLGAGMAFDVLARVTGKNLPISRIRVEKFCADTMFKADRVRDSGFVAPTKLYDALRDTIDAEFKDQVSAATSQAA